MSDTETSPRRWRQALEPISTVAMVIAAVVVTSVAIMNRLDARRGAPPRPEAPLPKEPISLEGAALKGDVNANIVLMMFSDFQCPFCKKFAVDTLPRLDLDYVSSRKVLLAFWNLPLDNHQFAHRAGEAAECARQQGKFWEMHDELFGSQNQLDDSSLRGRAQKVGLDLNVFGPCFEGGAKALVDADISRAKQLGVSGTPGFVVGLRQKDGTVKLISRLSGAKPYAEFQKVLDKLLTGAPAS